jgi:hypothetical protein
MSRRSERSCAPAVCCLALYDGTKPDCSALGYEPRHVEEMTDKRDRIVLIADLRATEDTDPMCPEHYGMLLEAYGSKGADALAQERSWRGWAVGYMRVRFTLTRATTAARPTAPAARPSRRRAARPHLPLLPHPTNLPPFLSRTARLSLPSPPLPRPCSARTAAGPLRPPPRPNPRPPRTAARRKRWARPRGRCWTQA